MKYELAGKIMIKFVGLRVRTFNYLIHDGSKDKKVKGTKKCHDKKIKKNCLEATEHKNKINYLEKNNINTDSLKKIINNSKKQQISIKNTAKIQ